MEEAQSLKQISKGAGIILIGILISKLLGYVYRMIIARVGSFEYGLLSIGLAFFGILGVIAVFGLDTALVRFAAYYREKKDLGKLKGVILSALKVSGILAVIFAILLFVFSNFIAQNFFHNPKLHIVFKVFSFAIPFYVIRTLFLSIIRGFQKVRYEVYSRDISENVIRVVLTIFLLYYGVSTFGISAVYLLALAFSCLIAIYFFHNKVSTILKNKIRPIPLTRELLGYSWPLTFSFILMLIMMWTDTLMLGYFRTVPEVGVYNAVMPTAHLMRIFTTALMTLFLPVITGLVVQRKDSVIKSVYRTVNKWICFVTLPLLGLFIIFPKQILVILFGQEYGQGGLALAIISVGYFVYCLALVSSNLLLVIEKTKLLFFNFLISAFVNVLLNYLLIPTYGIVGAAIATSASFIVVSLLFFVQTFTYLKILPFHSCYLKIFFSIGVSSTVIFLLKSYLNIGANIPLLILVSLIFATLYIGLLLLTKSFEKEDIMIIKVVQNKIGLKLNFVNKLLPK